MPDSPADGDVLITTEQSRHYLSIVPHAHRMSFDKISRAIDVANRWADFQRVQVWHLYDGVAIRLPRDPSVTRASES